MLENLLEIEVAYSLLKSANDGGDDGKSKDPIDAHYEKLKTDIKVGKLSLFSAVPSSFSEYVFHKCRIFFFFPFPVSKLSQKLKWTIWCLSKDVKHDV